MPAGDGPGRCIHRRRSAFRTKEQQGEIMTAGQLRQINIERFENLLTEVMDSDRRQVILSLLTEERARYAGDAVAERRVIC